MATISMLARQPAPLRIFADEHEAATWLFPRLGAPSHGADASRLLSEAEELARSYDRYLAENF